MSLYPVKFAREQNAFRLTSGRDRLSNKPLPSGPQFQALQPGRNIEPDLPLKAERL